MQSGRRSVRHRGGKSRPNGITPMNGIGRDSVTHVTVTVTVTARRKRRKRTA
jgi:hypothetical protein